MTREYTHLNQTNLKEAVDLILESQGWSLVWTDETQQGRKHGFTELALYDQEANKVMGSSGGWVDAR